MGKRQRKPADTFWCFKCWQFLGFAGWWQLEFEAVVGLVFAGWKERRKVGWWHYSVLCGIDGDRKQAFSWIEKQAYHQIWSWASGTHSFLFWCKGFFPLEPYFALASLLRDVNYGVEPIGSHVAFCTNATPYLVSYHIKSHLYKKTFQWLWYHIWNILEWQNIVRERIRAWVFLFYFARTKTSTRHGRSFYNSKNKGSVFQNLFGNDNFSFCIYSV